MTDRTSTLGAGHPAPDDPAAQVPCLPRPQVRRTLDAAHRMTVLRTPLGFGKTLAITSWLATMGDCGDTGSAVGSGVASSAEPRTGQAARRTLTWHRLSCPPTSSRSFWAELAADLTATLLVPLPGDSAATTYDDVLGLVAALTSPLLLVIDGLEAEVSTPTSDLSPVGAIVTEIVDLLHASAHLRVVISCRPYGALAMDALFGPGAVILDSAAFAFDEADTITAATAVGVHLTPAQAHHLQSKLWGWPSLTVAVLQGLASSRTGYDESSWEKAGDFLSMVDTQRLDPEVGHFIRQVSILDPLTGPLADRLTGSPFASRALTDLERAGLARSHLHDGERRYALLPAVVHSIKTRPAAAAEYAPAHRHAAKMFRNTPALALRHAVLAQDWDLVVSICDSRTETLVLTEPRAMLGALMRVPTHLFRRRPGLARLRDVLARFDDDHAFDRPTTVSLPHEALDPPALRRTLTVATAQVLALRACHLDIAADNLVDRCAQMLLRPQVPLDAAGMELPLFLLHAGITRCLVGSLTEAVAHFEECFDRSSATSLGFLARAAAEYSALARVLLGDVSGARRSLERAREHSRALVTLQLVDDGLDSLVGAFIALDELDLKTARRLLPAPCRTQDFDVPPAWFVDEYVRAHLHVLIGDLFSATTGLSRALADHRTSLGRGTLSSRLLTATAATINVWAGNTTRAKNFLDVVPATKLVNVVHADVALQVGDVEAALAIADAALAEVEVPDRLRVEMLLTRTVARDRQGDRSGAATDLAEAIELADPLLLRPFLAVPRGLLTDLEAQVPEATGLLARLEATGIILTPIEQQAMVHLDSTELDLLRALESGASMEVIASRLQTTTAGAVAVVEDLFQLLGVHDRLGAIAAGHMLGYLGVPGT